MVPFRAFAITEKFGCNNKECCSFSNFGWQSYLMQLGCILSLLFNHIQLCVMQLLLALMSCKATLLILFLETVCLGKHAFGLVRGVAGSGGDQHTLALDEVPWYGPSRGSALPLWISKIRKKISLHADAASVQGQIWILVRNNVS